MKITNIGDIVLASTTIASLSADIEGAAQELLDWVEADVISRLEGDREAVIEHVDEVMNERGHRIPSADLAGIIRQWLEDAFEAGRDNACVALKHVIDEAKED